MKKIIVAVIALLSLAAPVFGAGACGGEEPSANPDATAAATQTAAPAEPQFVAIFAGDWPPEARGAWEIAARTLESHLSLTVPVEVELTFAPLGDGLTGSGGATSTYVNFRGAQQPDTAYPIALANQLAGIRLGPGPDVQITIDSKTAWFWKADPTAARRAKKADFVTTLVHEIVHGLGFLGTADLTNGIGSWGTDGAVDAERHRRAGAAQVAQPLLGAGPAGSSSLLYPDIYDRFVVNGLGHSILDQSRFPNPSRELARQLVSNDLYWGGPKGMAANGGRPIKLYAPIRWEPASSYGHLDDDAYGTGADAIMTSASDTMPNADIGPRTLGILADLGWVTR